MTQPTTPETPADAGTPTPFEVGLQLRWSDEDRYGHVNNARLLTLTEEARVRALAAWATTTASPDVQRVVRSMEVQYEAPVVYAGPEVTARVWILRIGRTSFTLRLGTPLVEDVAVPRSRMAEMFARIREIEARTGVAIPTTAHAGDGNLHPILLFGAAAQVGGAAEDAASIPADVWEAAGELFRAGLELGGTLTGEHGVGLLKRAFLRDELGDAQHDLQQRIKAVFDPHGILNPGKVFTP